MVAVHNGTANINKRNVINVKCVNCMYCIDTVHSMDEKQIYYVCNFGNGINFVEECIANDDNMGCDMYVEDGYDDFTARCNQRIN